MYMLLIIQDCSHKMYIILIEIYIPSSTLYEMSKQIKGFYAAAVFVFLVF